MILPAPRLCAALLISCALVVPFACVGDNNASGAPDAGHDVSATGGDGSLADAAPAEADAPDVFATCPATRSSGSFPSDVMGVLAAKCQTCHQSPTKNHAPFPLLTYADTQEADRLPPYTGVPIWQVMHAVIQPAGVPHMPFGNAPQLTGTEMQTLDGWLLACALPVTDDDAGSDASIQALSDGPNNESE